MVVFNTVELLISFYIYHLVEERMQSESLLGVFFIINISLLCVVDLSYFLTQVLNPGVKDLQ